MSSVNKLITKTYCVPEQDGVIDWLNKNYDAIVAGILSSIIVIALQIFVRSVSQILIYYFTSRLYLSHIYQFKNGDVAYVISGSLPKPENDKDDTTLIKGPDANGANLIVRTLEEILPKSNIKHLFTHNTTSTFQIKDENIVTVGGPKFNSFTRSVSKYLPNSIAFDDKGVLHIKDREYCKDVDNCKDFGVIIRIHNPFRDKKNILIIAGCGTYGVLAASYVLTKNQRYPGLKKSLIKKLPYRTLRQHKEFYAIVSCDTNNNEVGNPKIIHAETILRNDNIIT